MTFGPFSGLVRTAVVVAITGTVGCAGRTSYEMVQFPAPSSPDPAVAPMMKDVSRVGVISITTVGPTREFDVEKVMGRLVDGVAIGMGNLPGLTVLSQDEIRWHFNYASLDSMNLMTPGSRTRLREELNLDAMVYVELNKLQAQVTPVSPTPSGNMVSTPGIDLSVRLHVTLFNLHTDKSWRHDRGETRRWQPIQQQLLGGGDQTERQLFQALSMPLRQFLARVAPPPRRQVRYFEVSGN